MKIFVTVKTKSRKKAVEKIDEKHFRVSVPELPIEGKANAAAIEALSEYLNLPQSSIIITSGKSAKQKIVEIVK